MSVHPYGDCRECARLRARCAELEADKAALLNAVRLPLLFHHGGDWRDAPIMEWEDITGTQEGTTKVMCDHIRKVLSEIAARSAAAKGDLQRQASDKV